MNIVREGYTDFYKAVCVWNHKKNFTTFKRLFAVCGAPWAHSWKKLWFIVKNTANGRYKEIEKISNYLLTKRVKCAIINTSNEGEMN